MHIWILSPVGDHGPTALQNVFSLLFSCFRKFEVGKCLQP